MDNLIQSLLNKIQSSGASAVFEVKILIFEMRKPPDVLVILVSSPYIAQILRAALEIFKPQFLIQSKESVENVRSCRLNALF